MNKTAKQFLYWTPRLLCFAFAAFLSLFALDVFSEPMSLGQRLLALLIHLVPTTGLFLFVLFHVWRREWLGAILFPALAALHLVTKWGQLDWGGYLGIEAPLMLLGVMFWLNWRYRTILREDV